MFIYSMQNTFTILMFMEAVSEEPMFSNFLRNGECVLKVLFLTLESIYLLPFY